MKCCFITSSFDIGEYENDDKLHELLNFVEACNVDELVITNSNELEYKILMSLERCNENDDEDAVKHNFKVSVPKSLNLTNEFNNLVHLFNLINDCDMCVILNKKKDTASRSMITFLVINTSGLTIIPTTIISLRMMYDSVSPTSIVFACIISTFFSTLGGIIVDRLLARRNKN